MRRSPAEAARWSRTLASYIACHDAHRWAADHIADLERSAVTSPEESLRITVNGGIESSVGFCASVLAKRLTDSRPIATATLSTQAEGLVLCVVVCRFHLKSVLALVPL